MTDIIDNSILPDPTGTETPETALERLVVYTAMTDAQVASNCEAVLKPLLTRLEQAEGELSAARNELHCCDDVPLDGGIVTIIAALDKERCHSRDRATQAEARAERAEVLLRRIAHDAAPERDNQSLVDDDLLREAREQVALLPEPPRQALEGTP